MYVCMYVCMSAYKELYFPRKILKLEVDVNTYYYYYCCCCCRRWWHLLLGSLVLRPSISSLLQSATSVITKCDSFFLLQSAMVCYYKVRRLLQSATVHATVTNIIFLFFLRILTFWNRKYKYYCLYFSFITLYQSFITFLWQAFCDRWTLWIALFRCFENEFKKSCALCRNFISVYKINRTLHGRLGIRILSSGAEGISHSFASLTHERYFQHSKIKFVSPRGHVISSM